MNMGIACVYCMLKGEQREHNLEKSIINPTCEKFVKHENIRISMSIVNENLT